MERRQYLAVLAGMLSVAGCTGIQGETITMLAVNQDDTSHVVTVWAVRHEELTVANTVEVASEAIPPMLFPPPQGVLFPDLQREDFDSIHN